MEKSVTVLQVTVPSGSQVWQLFYFWTKILNSKLRLLYTVQNYEKKLRFTVLKTKNSVVVLILKCLFCQNNNKTKLADRNL